VVDQVPSNGYHDCDISKQQGCCISHGDGISRIAGYGTCSEGCSLITDVFWACDDDSDCSIGEKCTTYFSNKRCMGPS
jgi:hypothetical protein